MLVLTREVSEGLDITTPDGVRMHIHIIEVRGHKVRIGIDAPKEYVVWRTEIQEQIDAKIIRTVKDVLR